MTKAAWVPYFGLFGVPEWLAYRLMPLIGSVDIALGIAALLSPRRALLLCLDGPGRALPTITRR